MGVGVGGGVDVAVGLGRGVAGTGVLGARCCVAVGAMMGNVVGAWVGAPVGVVGGVSVIGGSAVFVCLAIANPGAGPKPGR